MKKFFPDISVEDLESVVERYRNINAWCETPYFEEDGFNRLMEIMQEASELDKIAPYKVLVNNEIVKEVLY